MEQHRQCRTIPLTTAQPLPCPPPPLSPLSLTFPQPPFLPRCVFFSAILWWWIDPNANLQPFYMSMPPQWPGCRNIAQYHASKMSASKQPASLGPSQSPGFTNLSWMEINVAVGPLPQLLSAHAWICVYVCVCECVSHVCSLQYMHDYEQHTKKSFHDWRQFEGTIVYIFLYLFSSIYGILMTG